jgi:hypothetical protein
MELIKGVNHFSSYTNQLYICCLHWHIRHLERNAGPTPPLNLARFYKFLIQADPSSGRKFAGQLEL